MLDYYVASRASKSGERGEGGEESTEPATNGPFVPSCTVAQLAIMLNADLGPASECNGTMGTEGAADTASSIFQFVCTCTAVEADNDINQ